MQKSNEKSKCTCGTDEPCYVHESAKACTCDTGEPCCVHEVEKGKEKEAKMSGGCCEPGCGPGVCKQKVAV